MAGESAGVGEMTLARRLLAHLCALPSSAVSTPAWHRRPDEGWRTGLISRKLASVNWLGGFWRAKPRWFGVPLHPGGAK
jgi:hypothetical protein